MGAFDSILNGGRNAYGLITTTGVVSVSASPAPTAGQVLVATDPNTAAWASAPVTQHLLGSSSHAPDTLANLNALISDATLIDTNDSRLSDARVGTGLKTATGVVDVQTAAAPSAGQALVAIDAVSASWQDVITNPGGANQQLQFNDNGVFAGAAGVLYDKVANSFQVTGEFLSPGAGAGSFKIGLSAGAGGLNSFTLGNNSSSTGDETLLVGNSITANSTFSYNNIAIGSNISFTDGGIAGQETFDNIVIGRNSLIGGTSPGVSSSIIIGNTSSVEQNGSLDVLNAIVIGNNSKAQGEKQIIIGNVVTGSVPTTTPQGMVAITNKTGTQADSSVVIGGNPNSSAVRAVAVGINSNISTSDGTGVGYNALISAGATGVGSYVVSSSYGCAFGYYSEAAGTSAISIGRNSYGVNYGIAIGYYAKAYGQASPINPCISIGRQAGSGTGTATLYSLNSINIGNYTYTGKSGFPYPNRAIAIGYQANAAVDDGAAFGYQSSSQHTYSWALGYQSVSTDVNQFNVGSSVQPLKIVSHKDFEIADITNNDATDVVAGDVVVMNGVNGFAKATIANQKTVMVVARDALTTNTTELISSGKGSVYVEPNTVVAVGDTLVSSGITAATATVDNAETDPSKIIGYAWEAKTTGTVRELTTFKR